MRKNRVLFSIVALTALLAICGTVSGALQERPAASSPVLIGNGQQLNNAVGRGVALADFNGDGKLDAFVVNESRPKSQGLVYFGDGRGSFADSGQRLDLPAAMRSIAFDIDGDGRPDVVSGKTAFLNDGEGRFVLDDARFVDDNAALLMQVRAADLDADGRTDLFAVAMMESGAEARVYLQDQQGRFRFSGPGLRPGGILAAVELGDINGDGFIDAVTSGWRDSPTDPCPNRVFFNDGRGRFTDSGQVFDEELRHSHGLALADLDGDEDLDFVLVTQQPPFARLYWNDGHGSFSAGATLGTGGVEKTIVADLDGDGDPDIFLAGLGPDEVWLNDGRGRFTDSALRLGREWSWEVAAGDINADGRMDLFVVNLGVDRTASPAEMMKARCAEVWLNETPRRK